MLKFQEDKNSALPDRIKYRADVSLSAPGNSDFVVVPEIATSVTAVCVPGTTSTGKIQYSASNISAVIAGTATWLDWPSGTVSVATSDTFTGNAVAVRAVCATGTLTASFTIGTK